MEHESKPAMEHESKPAMEHESEPAMEHESEPAMEHESEPAMEHESKPAMEHESEPAMEHESKPAMEHESSRRWSMSPIRSPRVADGGNHVRDSHRRGPWTARGELDSDRHALSRACRLSYATPVPERLPGEALPRQLSPLHRE